MRFKRRFPVGAEPVAGGGTHFRVWAPKSSRVAVQFGSAGSPKTERAELAREKDGYYSGYVPAAKTGMWYRMELDSGIFPDPASRFQPEGPHGASEIIDPSRFTWHDQEWTGVARSGQVIYELHIGTFTPEGTFAAAQKQLPALAEVGVTLIEIMPVAEFPGAFGWGYDGVDLFAPTRLYGRPDELRHFVDCAHSLGLGVILDVVYNHFGPDGNYLKQFSEDYFTRRYANEWGEAINFDGENAGPVREFVCSNAAYWVEEFHMDGLRLDATQQIFDASPEHVIKELCGCVRKAAPNRRTYVVSENECQHAILVRDVKQGGYGLDAIWNDDWHHIAAIAASGHSEAYYSDFKGSAQEFVSAAKRGFIYQGQRSGWQKQSRGTGTKGLMPEQFVICLQNHDQVANSLLGKRVHQVASAGRLRALTALLLLGPSTPMLFQGQEFAASAPFLYFADHKPDLAPLVAEGRKGFLSQFPSVAHKESVAHLIEPHSKESFQRCKLDWSEKEKNRAIYLLHADLIKLRREDPVFSRPQPGGVDGAVLAPECFVLRFFSEEPGDRLMLVNLGPDLLEAALSEPLVAAPEGSRWQLIWSSESPRYDGCGTADVNTESGWRIPGHSAVVLAAEPFNDADGEPR
ncbi:MAG TPA: malto-oligosyltrehalose trehalohydrolase [Verrucomicrobiae bacterium]|nr:malto-oligosyltrehalose trehalohydrolase [Verrucomicrobiae bacterium]